MSLSIYQRLYQSIYLSIYLSLNDIRCNLSIYLSIYLYTNNIYIMLYVCMYVCIYTYTNIQTKTAEMMQLIKGQVRMMNHQARARQAQTMACQAPRTTHRDICAILVPH